MSGAVASPKALSSIWPAAPTKKIEEVTFGDRVLADNKGTILTVTNVAEGEETNPMYQITAHGHTVLLTGTHPVIAKNGVIAASNVKASDSIETLGGFYPVSTVKKGHGKKEGLQPQRRCPRRQGSDRRKQPDLFRRRRPGR